MKKFICPNCLGKKILSEKFVSIEPPKDKNPWSSISQIIQCGTCKKKIPAHLGERWNNISINQAKEKYKEYN